MLPTMGNNSSPVEKILTNQEKEVKEDDVQRVLRDLTVNQSFPTIWGRSQIRVNLNLPVITWKFCYLLHYITMERPEEIREYMSIDRINYLSKLGDNLLDDRIYKRLVKTYREFLLAKFTLLKQYSDIPGNFDMTEEQFTKNELHKDAFPVLLEMAEKAVKLQEHIWEVMCFRKIPSISDEAKCMLTPFVKLFIETLAVRDLITTAIFKSKFAGDLEQYESQVVSINEDLNALIKERRLKNWLDRQQIPYSIKERLKV